MNRADAAAVRTVGRAAWVIGKAVDLVVRALSRGGRVQPVIAGGSGAVACVFSMVGPISRHRRLEGEATAR